jgi:hypothetical protein
VSSSKEGRRYRSERRSRSHWRLRAVDKRRALLPTLAFAIALLIASVTLAQTGNGYDLTWWTVDGGGDRVSDGIYTLMGTAGQPEPGPILTGGDYALLSGFWPGGGATAPAPVRTIYLPLVGRSN